MKSPRIALSIWIGGICCLLGLLNSVAPAEEVAPPSPDKALEAAKTVLLNKQKEVDQLLLDGRVGEALTGLLAPLPSIELTSEEAALLKEVNDTRLLAYEAAATLTPTAGDSFPLSAPLPKKTAEEIGAERAARYQNRYVDGVFREVAQDGKPKEWTNGRSVQDILAKGVLEIKTSPRGWVTEREPFSLKVALNFDGKPVKDYRLAAQKVQVIAPEGVPLDGTLQVPLKDGVADFGLTIARPTKKVELKVALVGAEPPRELAIPPFNAEIKIDEKGFRDITAEWDKLVKILGNDPDSLERERKINELVLEMNELLERLAKNSNTPSEFLVTIKGMLTKLGRPPVE